MGDSLLSPLSLQEPPSPLQLLLQSQSERWDYAIFWKASNAADGRLCLSWGAGYYHGQSSPVPPNTKLGSPESEWFYMASITRSFAAADDLVFRALVTASSIWLAGHRQLSLCRSERAKEAQLYGVGTLALVPISSGVVELGSSGLIQENWSLINLITNSFDPRDHTRGFASSELRDSDDSKVPRIRKRGSSSSEPRESSDDSHGLVRGASDIPSPRKMARGARDGRQKSRPNNVEAEKRRREHFNQRFYALRSVVPNVSKMDKASLLADAVDYINQLESTVANLEAKCTRLSETSNIRSMSFSIHGVYGSKAEIGVKISGTEATVRVESTGDHPCARAMNALRDLELEVSRAIALEMEDVMFQEIVIRVPHGLYSEEALKRTIAMKMEAY